MYVYPSVQYHFYAHLPINVKCGVFVFIFRNTFEDFAAKKIEYTQLYCTALKIEWKFWVNSIHFAIHAVKSKQAHQTSKTVTMTW